MNLLRALSMIFGLGVALAGLYLVSDGITGFATAKGSLFSQPQIPLGLIIIVVGVTATILMEKLVFKKSVQAEEQKVVSAPAVDTIVKETPKMETAVQPAQTVMQPNKQIQVQTTDSVPAERIQFQFPVVQVQNEPKTPTQENKPAKQIEFKKVKKAVKKTAAKRAKKTSKSKPAKKAKPAKKTSKRKKR